MRPTVILVSGSREWEDKSAIYEALKVYPFGSILIHGGCRGADVLCGRFGASKGFKVWELPYCEDEDGNEVRNESMVAVAAALRDMGHPLFAHAFPLPGSVGTPKCMRIAKKHGIEFKVHK